MLRQSRRLVRWEVWCTCVLDEVVCCIATKRCEEYQRTCTLHRWIGCGGPPWKGDESVSTGAGEMQ
jgi:hypothetical protein